MTNKTTAEDTLELETINKMFLELSQFATAKTKREIELESRINAIAKEVEAIDTVRGYTNADEVKQRAIYLITKHTE